MNSKISEFICSKLSEFIVLTNPLRNVKKRPTGRFLEPWLDIVRQNKKKVVIRYPFVKLCQEMCQQMCHDS